MSWFASDLHKVADHLIPSTFLIYCLTPNIIASASTLEGFRLGV